MEIYQITNDNTLKISATKSNKKHGASIMALTVFASFSLTTSMINIKTNAKEGIASFTQPNLNKTENKPINNYNLNKDDKIELTERNFISSNKNEIWNFNDKKLEVDELVEKVSQTQLNEVKDHFDTKISSLKKDIELMFEQQENKRLSEKLEVIHNANKNKDATIKWFIGTAIALTGLVFTIMKFFN